MRTNIRDAAWEMRMIVTDSSSLKMLEKIMIEVGSRKVYWHELPDFVKVMLREQHPYIYGLLLADEGGIRV